jgi:PAS domain S-box-containing protein
MVYIDLILNLTLLVALSVVSGFIEQRWPRHTRIGAMAQGVLFGGVTVIGMFRPLELEPGLFFDGRSVMLSICALFYGPLASVVSCLAPLACRWVIGGPGMIMGMLTIFSSATVGLIAHHLLRVQGRPLTVRSLFLFGIFVHLALLAMTFALPPGKAWPAIQKIGLPVLVFYPLATILVGKILLDHEFKLRFIDDLQQAREQLDTTLRSIQDAVISTDMRGRILYMNPVAEKLTGWSRFEARNKTLVEVVSVVDQERRAQSINPVERVLVSGMPVQLASHTLLIGRDGSERHVSENASPMRDPAGQLTGVVLVFRDITSEYQTREQLRKSEVLFRNLFEHHAAVKLIIEPDSGAILEANDAAATFYGWSRQQLKDIRIQDINILTMEEIRQEVETTKANQCIPCEFRHRLADGSVRDVEVFSSIIEVQGRSLLHSIVHDVTARKKAERDLQSSQEYLSSIFRAAPVGIGVVVDRVFVIVNDHFCEMTGFSREELLGQSSRMLYMSDEEYEFVGTEKYAQITQHDIGTVETTWQRKDGTCIDILLCSSPLDPKHLDAGVTFTALDISMHKQAEQEKEKLSSQLMQSQKIDSIGRLTGGVAHDFNNLLSVILGYTEIAMNETPSGSALHGNLQKIQEAGRRSADIVKQLLAFSRQQTIDPKVVDLNGHVGKLVKMLQRLIGENIHLEWMPSPFLPPVFIDQTQIDQILINLCTNARDAIDGVGAITIETSAVSVDAHYCARNAGFIPGDYVMLSVSDNGNGMTSEVVGKIFEPFFTTKGVGQGTGLGLATVYGIIKQNNGFINVYSEPEKGTTFRMYFPQHAESEEVDAREKSAAPEKSHGEIILLVEDDPVLLDMGKTMLERLGYKVLTGLGPLEALRVVEETSAAIDLLMTDVIMPEMNGRELSNRLLERYPNLKVLYMSGYTANVIAHHGVLDPGIHFLSKPFSSKELSSRIRDVLA